MDSTAALLLDHKKNELLKKGDLDLRSAIIRLINVQSAVVVYATQQNIAEVMENFKEIQKEIHNIDKVSANIKRISQKTRMLSINAAIEAASAGHSGNGFSIVADEIGKLSTQTTKCTDEVDKVNQNMLADAKVSWGTLGKLESNLLKFEQSHEKTMEEVLKNSVIEENGFILTTLAKRLENHADFMTNLLQNIGRETKVKLTDHQSCAFGKWYEQNMDKYRHFPIYAAVYEPHKAFHDAAIAFSKTKDIDVLIQFLELSHEILEKFLALTNLFKEECQKSDSYFQGLI